MIKSLGFTLKVVAPVVLPDGTTKHVRGARKKPDSIPWDMRCKKHHDGARRKGFTSITDRWDREVAYHANVDEQSMDYWNKHATRETAVSMDLVVAR